MTSNVTVTINPAVDVSTAVDRVEPVRKLLCSAERREPGGGGINVGRVINRLGADVVAVYAAGGVTGEVLHQLVAREGVAASPVSVGGTTRESFTVISAEIIALPLGSEGALLVTRDAAWFSEPLPVKVMSSVGAGDSFLGALVWSLAAGRDLADALRYAVAAGSAALLAPGTQLCKPEDVHRLAADVTLRPI